MGVFAVTMEKGPAWDGSRARREQDGWDEHAAFMDRLVDEGFVLLGGPLGDGERVLLGVEAADEAEARGRLAGAGGGAGGGPVGADGPAAHRPGRALEPVAGRPPPPLTALPFVHPRCRGRTAPVESQITLRVDGADRTLRVDTRTTLLDALRERLRHTSPKKGCDHGQCGA